ncbi:MAG: NAD-dependent deacylase [Hyphomicrobiaceae bacterium]|nr:NAD-dependent deacylase [Hyphomicrobiaceae bacterium]
MSNSRYSRIVILTGAGISAESGLATFRDKGGVWAQYDYQEVATPEGFERNPEKVHAFYNMRRRNAQTVQPNAAHRALALLERELPLIAGVGAEVLVVTQNVDNLHETAGSRHLVHMHGELMKAWCTYCDTRMPWIGDMSSATVCPTCSASGGVRPDIVWFGEMPYHLEMIASKIDAADLFISIGTSGNVYPAAGFVSDARRAGAHTVELNLEPSEGACLFAEVHHGPASEIVPTYVDRVLDGSV